MSRKWLTIAVAAGLVIALIGGGFLAVRAAFFAPTTITAFFPTVTAIYPGDDVKISGITVGTIESIEPQGTKAKMTISVDHGIPVPADAKAVVVAQNLVAARYVQLTPAYRSSRGGPKMADGAVIPLERTAVPVEWDDVKKQLERLATDLGPSGNMSTTSVGRFIDSAANALDGNGEKLRDTLKQLSGVGRILADGSGNFVGILKNLQVFVTALRDSNDQIVLFNERLATLSSVLDGSKSDLDAALTNLSVALTEVKRFVAGTRDKTAEQLQGLQRRDADVGRREDGFRTDSPHRAHRVRQRLQHLRSGHRHRPRRILDSQLGQPHAARVRRDRRHSERHGAGDGEAVPRLSGTSVAVA